MFVKASLAFLLVASISLGLYQLDKKVLVDVDNKQLPFFDTSLKSNHENIIDFDTYKESAILKLPTAIQNQYMKIINNPEHFTVRQKTDFYQTLQESDRPFLAAMGYQSLLNQVTDNKPNNLVFKAADAFFIAIQKLAGDEKLASMVAENGSIMLKKALKIKPNNLNYKAGDAIADILQNQQPMQSIATLKAILSQQPNHYVSNYFLGLFSMKTGQFEKAILRFEKICEFKQEAEIYFYLGECYEKNNQPKKAIFAFEKVDKMIENSLISQNIRTVINRIKKNNNL